MVEEPSMEAILRTIREICERNDGAKERSRSQEPIGQARMPEGLGRLAPTHEQRSSGLGPVQKAQDRL
ncbi:MAG: hypothetical protein JO141_14995 [Bradyrhizobium sp.]|nr:hypothetical protein [Bradyrhizobium sp.]